MTQTAVATRRLELIDAELEARIIQIGVDISNRQWELARIVTELYRLNRKEKIGKTKAWINARVGSLAGVSARSIRYYAAVAENFTEAEQHEFEPLPFSHFEFAGRFPLLKREILQTSLRRMDVRGGRPPSVEWLEMKFMATTTSQYEAEMSSQPGSKDPGDGVVAGEVFFEDLPDTAPSPDPFELAGAAQVPDLSGVVGKTLYGYVWRALWFWEDVLGRIPISDQTRDLWQQALEAMREELPETD